MGGLKIKWKIHLNNAILNKTVTTQLFTILKKCLLPNRKPYTLPKENYLVVAGIGKLCRSPI